jgi:hypothetical protein
MRTHFLPLFLLGVFLSLAADPPAKEEAPKDAPAKKQTVPTGLRIGENLPGPFHPYNVTGPYKRHFHCLISDHGLDPLVMVFHKNLEFSDPLAKLLEDLDKAIEKNPNARLAAFAVFLADDLPEVVGANDKDDDARDLLAKKLEDEAVKRKLQHVVLCLDTKADLEKYELDDRNLVTVVLVRKYKVEAIFALPKDQLNDATVEKILAAVKEKLGATR